MKCCVHRVISVFISGLMRWIQEIMWSDLGNKKKTLYWSDSSADIDGAVTSCIESLDTGGKILSSDFPASVINFKY